MADLIDRQAAIDTLMKEWKAYKDYPYVSHVRHGLEIAIAILDNKVPSAQRTGRWIDGKVKHIKNGELRNVRECSECGSSYFVYDYYNSVDEIPKFCPNCGVDMRGEQDG